MKNPNLFLTVLVAASTLTACESTQPHEAAPAQTTLQLPMISVKSKALVEMLRLPGIVFALPDRSVKVSPGISGKLTDIRIAPGQHVMRGQTIAVLDNRQLTDQLHQTKARVLVAKAGVELAKTNLQLAQDVQERNERLVAQDVGAQKDLIAARSQVESAKAQVLSAQAQVDDAVAAEQAIQAQFSYTTVKSPITGVVAQRYLNVSDSADTATPIAQIVDLSQVVVEAELPTTQPAKLKKGETAKISAKALPGIEFNGEVSSVSPVTDNQGTTVGVRIACKNPDYNLKEGMPVSVSIDTGRHASTPVVPIESLVSDPDNPDEKMVYVFKDGKIARAKVKTGMQVGSVIEITSGLHVGESIVAAGAYGVPDGTEVEPQSGAVHSTPEVTSKSD